VEDVGIVMGKALHQALGEKAGIKRFGFASAPLDETLAQVTVDLSAGPISSTTWHCRIGRSKPSI
jgi:imidazoleglycerol-phosphate dehydratase